MKFAKGEGLKLYEGELCKKLNLKPIKLSKFLKILQTEIELLGK